jgi:hypothetical protein
MHVRLKTLLLLVSPLLLTVAAAYVQWGTAGLPALTTFPPPTSSLETAAEPYGFPAWLRITHYVNLFFLILLIRSGLQILMDHPRLYWNVHCTPGTEWLRLNGTCFAFDWSLPEKVAARVGAAPARSRVVSRRVPTWPCKTFRRAAATTLRIGRGGCRF